MVAGQGTSLPEQPLHHLQPTMTPMSGGRFWGDTLRFPLRPTPALPPPPRCSVGGAPEGP